SAWSSSLIFSIATLGKPILVGPTGSISSDTPTFSWNSVSGADHYDVWVDDVTKAQSSVARNQDVIGTSWSPATALTASDSFRWWVRAVDSTNTNNGVWSAPLSFAIAPLEVPIPASPTDEVNSAEPHFSWSAVAGWDHYEVW